MPEDLPTPTKSVQELEDEELKKINGGCYFKLLNYIFSSNFHIFDII